MTNERIKRFRKGIIAEKYAALWLQLKGYHILERRYKTPVGEVDLIARRRNAVAFIEVKARKNLELAIESITPQQRRRIERATGLYSGKLKGDPCIRFDAVLVSSWRIKHIVGAWRLGE